VRSKIETALRKLVGLRLSGLGRAADLVWVQFGPLRRVPGVKQRWKFVGELALHLQCPWRLVRGSQIVAGWSDVFEPARRSRSPSAGTRSSRTLFDSRVRSVPLRRHRLTVLRTRADGIGGFSLLMSRGWALEVFPADSNSDPYSEWWRLFAPSRNKHHLVVSARGVEGNLNARASATVRSNPRLERTGARLARHRRAAVGAGRSTAGR
jgi:hypothetical protein